MRNDLDKFTIAYLECALWAESYRSGEQDPRPFDENYSIGDFTPEAIQKAIADCKKFQEENEHALFLADYGDPKYSNDRMAGHDFWLTRNGHGDGFGDGDIPPDIGAWLSKASENFGTCDLYLADDKTICML